MMMMLTHGCYSPFNVSKSNGTDTFPSYHFLFSSFFFFCREVEEMLKKDRLKVLKVPLRSRTESDREHALLVDYLL